MWQPSGVHWPGRPLPATSLPKASLWPPLVPRPARLDALDPSWAPKKAPAGSSGLPSLQAPFFVMSGPEGPRLLAALTSTVGHDSVATAPGMSILEERRGSSGDLVAMLGTESPRLPAPLSIPADAAVGMNLVDKSRADSVELVAASAMLEGPEGSCLPASLVDGAGQEPAAAEDDDDWDKGSVASSGYVSGYTADEEPAAAEDDEDWDKDSVASSGYMSSYVVVPCKPWVPEMLAALARQRAAAEDTWVEEFVPADQVMIVPWGYGFPPPLTAWEPSEEGSDKVEGSNGNRGSEASSLALVGRGVGGGSTPAQTPVARGDVEVEEARALTAVIQATELRGEASAAAGEGNGRGDVEEVAPAPCAEGGQAVAIMGATIPGAWLPSAAVPRRDTDIEATKRPPASPCRTGLRAPPCSPVSQLPALRSSLPSELAECVNAAPAAELPEEEQGLIESAVEFCLGVGQAIWEGLGQLF